MVASKYLSIKDIKITKSSALSVITKDNLQVNRRLNLTYGKVIMGISITLMNIIARQNFNNKINFFILYRISNIMSNSKDLGNGTSKFIGDLDNATTAKYVCKVCGSEFEDNNNLDSHIISYHHPKRTVTLNDIVNSVFKGQMNFPKTKSEIVKYVEEHKDDASVTPQVLDTLRNLPDKRYNNEAELSLELSQ